MTGAPALPEVRAVAENAECVKCGITAADLPHDDLGMTLDEASEFLFDHDGNTILCRGCA
jgi:hypothetical protein